jgi:surfactin synthase thioesterase subunit
MPKKRPVTLYCLAHAGAGVSSFHRWDELAGPDVRVVPLLLPGRGKRRREPRLTSRDGLLAELLNQVTEHDPDDGSFALYGHSLGALVAYTLTRAMTDLTSARPAFLAVGACPPPDTTPPVLHAAEAEDAELVEALGAAGLLPAAGIGVPGGAWYRMVLPVLRDDLRLADALRTAAAVPATGGPVSVPLLAVGGSGDPLAPAPVLGGWRRWTTSHFVQRTVPGDHFFTRGREAPRLLARACRIAQRAMAGTARV